LKRFFAIRYDPSYQKLHSDPAYDANRNAFFELAFQADQNRNAKPPVGDERGYTDALRELRCQLIAERTDIEESWRITSDSLALWLARRLGARCCYLIKSIARKPQKQVSAAQLARDCVVDAAFPAMLKEGGVSAVLLGRLDQAAFAAALSGDGACGAEID